MGKLLIMFPTLLITMLSLFDSLHGLAPVFVNYSAADVSRPARKPTLLHLSNVSIQNSLRSPRRLIRADTFRLREIVV